MNLYIGLTAFFLGAMHALEPGHGKAAIAAYAIGYRSNLRHILVLGLSTAIAHTFIILLLAVVFGAAISTVEDQRVHFWIEIASAGLLLLTGIWLLRRTKKNNKSDGDCEQKETSCNCRQHQPKIDKDKPLSFGFVSLLGLSSGLIPCPTALAVLLSAMTAGQFVGGLWTVVLFSLGLAVTICSVALLAGLIAKSSVKNKFISSLNLSRWASYVPQISSWIIIASGTLMLFRAIIFG